MEKFNVQKIDTAPEGSKDTLNTINKSWGFVPNLFGVLAESPATLKGAFSLINDLSSGELSPIEQQIVAIAAAREGNCHYCVAAHSTMAVGAKIDSDVLKQVRNGELVSDNKLEVLRLTTIKLVQERGWISEQDQKNFFSAGYSKAALLEVIGWVALKALTNYVNHIAQTPLDDGFSGQKWELK